MTDHTPLDIKVVYSASGKRRRRASAPRRLVGGTRRGRAIGSCLAWLTLGCIHFAAASLGYYVSWWRMDPWFYQTAVLKTPLPGVNLANAADLFGIPGSKDQAPPPGGSAPHEPNPDDEQEQQVPAGASTFSARTTQALIGASMYGWLTLATLACCLLALAGGAAWGVAGARRFRRMLLLALAVAVLTLFLAGYDVWGRYGMLYPVAYLRWSMGGLVVVSLLAGLAIGAGGKLLSRLAAGGIILSALGTVVCLYLLGLCDALEPRYFALPFLLFVFLAQSAYGWIVLAVAFRLRAW